MSPTRMDCRFGGVWRYLRLTCFSFLEKHSRDSHLRSVISLSRNYQPRCPKIKCISPAVCDFVNRLSEPRSEGSYYQNQSGTGCRRLGLHAGIGQALELNCQNFSNVIQRRFDAKSLARCLTLFASTPRFILSNTFA